MSDLIYAIKNNRFRKAFVEGFEINDDNSITSFESLNNVVIINPIDALNPETVWGRLSLKAKVEGNAAYMVFAAASDELIYPESETVSGYKSMFASLKAVRFVQQEDFLLYGFKGRYLYLCFAAKGDGSVTLSDIKIDRQGDNFMQTFPLVYREENGFFHRFMSVFSSIYNDMEEEIKDLPKILDLDTCDVRLLPIYAGWMGIDVGEGFLEEDVLRTLVKEAHRLNRMKGTRWCLERVSEIILGEKGIVVERNIPTDTLTLEQLKDIDKLYGASLYDVTILISKIMSEVQKAQLQYILDQFLPVRCKLHIVELCKTGTLDSYTYLDVNARVYASQEGSLDTDIGMDTMITLA